MKTLQKIGYASFATLALAETAFAQANNAFSTSSRSAEGKLVTGSSGDLVDTIQKMIQYFLGFVSFIAVCYALWAGFQILTAGGDDGKVKTGKTIIIQVAIGIIVMWLAYAVVSWVLGLLK